MMIRSLLLAICLVGLSDANALEGQLAGDQFPYVVRIAVHSSARKAGGECSATVLDNGLVVTAAHCIYDDVTRAPWESITILYGDKSVPAIRTYYSPLYPADKEARTKESDGHRATATFEAAYLIPKTYIRLPQYAASIFSLLQSTNSSGSDTTYISQIQTSFERNFGQILYMPPATWETSPIFHTTGRSLPAKLVGFGGTNCAQEKPRDCTQDHQQRFYETSVAPARDSDELLKRSTLDGATFVLRPPWMFHSVDLNGRIRPGDSGGPILIQSLRGGWFHVGVAVLGNFMATHASVLVAPEMWYQASMDMKAR